MKTKDEIESRLKYIIKPRLNDEKQKVKELDLAGHSTSDSRKRWFNMQKQTESLIEEYEWILSGDA